MKESLTVDFKRHCICFKDNSKKYGGQGHDC